MRSFRPRAELSALSEEMGRRGATERNYRPGSQLGRWPENENVSASLSTGGWAEYGVDEGANTEVWLPGTMAGF